ncbi:MAG: hypothetical protein EA359_06990, partial [Balneolaceae bacterium]
IQYSVFDIQYSIFPQLAQTLGGAIARFKVFASRDKLGTLFTFAFSLFTHPTSAQTLGGAAHASRFSLRGKN